MRTIRVGSRGSKLALIQTESVVAKLKRLAPELEISIVEIRTHGDRDQHSRLELVDGAGFFVKELEDALLDRRVDFAVHSLKDMPTELPHGLVLAAVPERTDPRDVLVTTGRRLSELPQGARIGTGSLRRSLQITALRPDVAPVSIRGNVDTRVGKVDSGEYDGLVTAAAALIRLGLKDRIVEHFDTERFLPAVGQGALAVECRDDDKEVLDLLNQINDVPSWQSVSAERAFLLALGGGCQAPIAALASVDGGVLMIDGLVASPGQNRVIRSRESGSSENAVEIGKDLASRLLKAGGGAFIEEAKRK